MHLGFILVDSVRYGSNFILCQMINPLVTPASIKKRFEIL